MYAPRQEPTNIENSFRRWLFNRLQFNFMNPLISDANIEEIVELNAGIYEMDNDLEDGEISDETIQRLIPIIRENINMAHRDGGGSGQRSNPALRAHGIEDKIYKLALKEITKMVGKRGITYSGEVDKIGKRLLGKKFAGVYAADGLRFPKGTKYAVVNLDKSYEPGSHWIGVVKEGKKLLIYDSFGRPGKKIIPILGKGKLIDTELDAEQDIKEENCGQRSLSALFIYDQFGRRMFMKL